MFTSRAEHRLLLREDNADLRLTETARNMGLIGDAQWAIFSQRREEITAEVSRLETQFVQPGSAQAKQIEPKIPLPLSREYSLADLLRRPELRYSDVADLVSLRLVTTDHAGEQVETQIKYAGYIDRQAEEIARLQRQENTPIPTHLDYNEVRGLSNEIRQKLLEARPTTLARAARISGVTPAAISLLLVHLRRLESAPNVSHA
jgi:tRNA uridine 5-carboxymethylaminomethyl modification enzyme